MEKCEFQNANSEDSSGTVCKICSKTKGIYVCPRCNILYCSLQCYQSEAHVHCSEAFYRDCVMEDLNLQERDPEAQKKMTEILRRLHSDQEDEDKLDSDDDDGIPDLHERLKNVNLDDADSVWDKLTASEQQEFEQLLQSGDASELLTPWEPWWLYRKKKSLVQEMGIDKETVFNYAVNCPPLKQDVPPFSQISKAVPAPCVKYNVVNLLCAYCYMTRFFNGEHHSMPAEASSTLIALSGNLSLNHTYDSALIAVEAVAHEVVNCSNLCGSEQSIDCMKSDVECILAGPGDDSCSFYLQAALSDTHSLLSEARHTKELGAIKKSGDFTKRFGSNLSTSHVPKEKLKMSIKKLEYYLSWSQDHASDICDLTLRL